MTIQKKETIERHIKTHSERSAEDCAAIATLESCFGGRGRVKPNFLKKVNWAKKDLTI